MADFNLSVNELFERAFGVRRGKPYDGQQLRKDEQVEIEYEDAATASEEGTEFVTVRDQLDARMPRGEAIFLPVKIGELLLPNEPTIAFTKRKKIVETALVGSRRRGTVKELISSEDWQITIRGIAINHESKIFYPEDQIKALVDLDKEERALDIVCALTSLLGIYRVVITQIRFPEMVGIQHAQAYELQCVSDEDFVLELN